VHAFSFYKYLLYRVFNSFHIYLLPLAINVNDENTKEIKVYEIAKCTLSDSHHDYCQIGYILLFLFFFANNFFTFRVSIYNLPLLLKKSSIS